MGDRELISGNSRLMLREHLVHRTTREISDVFVSNGFSPDQSHNPDVSGERRALVEQFYRGIDWSSREAVSRVLRVFEAVIDEAEHRESFEVLDSSQGWSTRFLKVLARDGVIREASGRLRPRWMALSSADLDRLPADSAIPGLLERMWGNLDDDPEAAISAAKDVLEATAKHVLLERGEHLTGSEKFPALIGRVNDVLNIQVKAVDSNRRGADSIRSVLGALGKIVAGVNELRNEYGTGHGRPKKVSGLGHRHALLAVQSAATWVGFVLATEHVRKSTQEE
jgi:hypothetical protein